MALRDQPYLPLYVQDFMTDEKLNECSARATGVYIRLMCIMHKSEHYGMILLKQKDKQNESNIKNFALKLARHMPYNLHEIEDSLNELIGENVIRIEGDSLIQKRMVKDSKLSETRALSGREGGKKARGKDKIASDFAQANNEAKVVANTENEIENENDNKKEKRGAGEKRKKDELNLPYQSEEFKTVWTKLIEMPKWKKKLPISLQMSLDKLKSYDEQFCIELIKRAIEGSYQGLVFADTDASYQKWKAQRGKPGQLLQTGNTEKLLKNFA